MKRIDSIIIILLTILTLSSCSTENEKSIVGEWQPAVRPYNLGTILIFGEDSSFTQIQEARVDYTYELVGDTLISTSINGYTGEMVKDSAHVIISEDAMILTRGKIGDQQETIMTRYDSLYTNKDGIIGYWKWPHQSGRDAISEYHPDGKASVSVFIERREGYYSTKNDSLTIVMPGTTLKDIYFEIKEDSLLFSDSKYAPLGHKFYRVRDEE